MSKITLQNFNHIYNSNISTEAKCKTKLSYNLIIFLLIQQSMRLQENQEIKRITINFSPKNIQVQKDKELNRLVRQLSHSKQSTKKYKKIIDRIKQSRIKQAQQVQEKNKHQDINTFLLTQQKIKNQTVEPSKKRRVRYHYLIETLRHPSYEEEKCQKQQSIYRKTMTISATQYSSLENHSRVHEIHRIRKYSQASSSLKKGCQGRSLFLAEAMVKQNLSVKKMKNSITNSYKITTMPISRPTTATKIIQIKRKDRGMQKDNQSAPLKQKSLPFRSEENVIKPWDWGEDICVELM